MNTPVGGADIDIRIVLLYNKRKAKRRDCDAEYCPTHIRASALRTAFRRNAAEALEERCFSGAAPDDPLYLRGSRYNLTISDETDGMIP